MDNNTELDSIDDRIPHPSWDTIDTGSTSTASSSFFRFPDLTDKEKKTKTNKQFQEYYSAKAAIELREGRGGARTSFTLLVGSGS